MLFALGLGCYSGVNTDDGPVDPTVDPSDTEETDVGVCLSPEPPGDGGGPGSSTGGESSTGMLESTSSGVGTSSGSGSGSSSGPSVDGDSGTGDGSDTGDGSTTGMAIEAPPGVTRGEVLRRVLDRGTLPADVAARLRETSDEG